MPDTPTTSEIMRQIDRYAAYKPFDHHDDKPDHQRRAETLRAKKLRHYCGAGLQAVAPLLDPPGALMHPHQLHAYTHLVSLARSWPALRICAGRAALEPADGIRATIYGTRTGSGGHGDGGVSAAASRVDLTRWTAALDRVAGEVTAAWWIARSSGQPATIRTSLAGRHVAAPLATIATALRHAHPTAARDIASYLAAADRTARSAAYLPPERLPLIGVPCPACGMRMLEAITTSPQRAAWTVVCGARCVCTGKGCSCGSDVLEAGLDHIWRWTVIAARAATSPSVHEGQWAA